MGIPLCSRLECWCSTATLPLPHNCGKIHTRGTDLRHSGVQESSPHSAHSHNHGPHCQWREKTHMHFTRRSSHRMRKSTSGDRRAPPGHPEMEKNRRTSADEAVLYNTFTQVHPTAFYPAPYALSPGRPTPSLTYNGGHSKAAGHTNTPTIHHKYR